ncbi:MAG: diacylglycerol kinase family lipid kinase [Nitrospirota bacterium]
MRSYVAIIANPNAGSASRRKVELAADLLGQRGFEVEVLDTASQGDATRLARKAAEDSPQMVVAAGGDGTYSEVANGLANTEVPMSLLPLGTSNVLAKEFEIPEDVRGAVERMLSGTTRTVSLAKVRWEGKERLFCLMAGIGFDGETVYATRGSALMGVSRKAAHVVKGLEVLARWEAPELAVTADGRRYEGSSVIVCNAAKYAGNMKVCPDASMLEPGLYMFLMRGRRRVDFARYALGVLRGANTGFRDVVYEKVGDVRVEGEAHMQADGDYLGMTPATITAGGAKLRLVV